jgi:uncharacterized FAD-dependent dehydrogenase
MDAAHYERIADCLMQFRGKLPKWKHLGTDHGQEIVKSMHMHIDLLLIEIDNYARMDDLGWIK